MARAIEASGIRDRRVLEAMRTVPRHRFVPGDYVDAAYADTALPIGHGQTISQPLIVAFMAEAARIAPGDRILEIGTGSGYAAAVASLLGREVFTIEIVEPLGLRARKLLRDLGYRNVTTRIGDGYRGWKEAAPFDVILLTAAPASVPQPLLDQLKVGGRLVAPVGEGLQDLVRLTRTPRGLRREKLLPVTFVPMTGEAERRPDGGAGDR